MAVIEKDEVSENTNPWSVSLLAAKLFSLSFLDTVFFHLPPRSEERTTVYGVSCYRQIEAKVTYSCKCKIVKGTGAEFNGKNVRAVRLADQNCPSWP